VCVRVIFYIKEFIQSRLLIYKSSKADFDDVSRRFARLGHCDIALCGAHGCQ
jgi:hypothetical protein